MSQTRACGHRFDSVVRAICPSMRARRMPVTWPDASEPSSTLTAGYVQGPAEYSWLPMSQRGGLLMLLRAVATLSHHSAGTDTHDARASTYAEMGIKVLKAEAGVHLAPLPGVLWRHVHVSSGGCQIWHVGTDATVVRRDAGAGSGRARVVYPRAVPVALRQRNCS